MSVLHDRLLLGRALQCYIMTLKSQPRSIILDRFI